METSNRAFGHEFERILKTALQPQEQIMETTLPFVTTSVKVSEFVFTLPAANGPRQPTGVLYIQQLGRVISDEATIREAAKIGVVYQLIEVSQQRELFKSVQHCETRRLRLLNALITSIQQSPLAVPAQQFLQALYQGGATLKQILDKEQRYVEIIARALSQCQVEREISLARAEEMFAAYCLLFGIIQTRRQILARLFALQPRLDNAVLQLHLSKDRMVQQAQQTFRELANVDTIEARFVPVTTAEQIKETVLQRVDRNTLLALMRAKVVS